VPEINAAGLALIEEFEGDELRAYPDPGTGGEPWTIGYGHTVGVHPGETITQEQAIQFLQRDVSSAELIVASAIEVELTPNQFSALVSFEYNTGAPASSTIFVRCNARDWEGAAQEFLRWIYAGGVVLQGLVNRRQAEKALFETP
jgi:lysozyme